MKRSISLLRIAFMASLLAVAWPTHADPWKDESGYGHGHDKGHGEREARYESERGDCSYEYKAGPHGYKEKTRCHDRHAKGGPPPWAPAHGYRDREHYRDDRYAAHDRYRAYDYAEVTDMIGIAQGTCNREVLGSILGGIAGGVIGSHVGKGDDRTVATVAGTVIGILVGRQVGRQMDQADQQCAGQVLERAADGETVRWRNPDTGQAYDVTPTQTREQNGQYCREYVTHVSIGGRTQQAWGTACRQEDGSWKLDDPGA